ncbi:MAG: signal peptidase I [Desulfobacterales bacterium]|nr:signal peptidase I [Desulfobacterales bacterium]
MLTKKEESVPQKKGVLRENVEALIIAIILALFIRTFIIQAFKIPSGSMKETLQIGDHILVNKFIYGVKLPFIQKTIIPIKNPANGDIVVFIYPKDPKKDYIKRVVGIGGDTVEIKNKQVYVNGEIFKTGHESYSDNIIYPLTMGTRDNLSPTTVPDGHLFVLGDNRDNSYDSRFWGFVPLKAVKGKAFIIYWSWNSENSDSIFYYVRWERLFNILR